MVQQYLVFEIRGESYGLPVEEVDEVQRMAWVTPVPSSPADVCGVVDVRGSLVVVLEPSARLGHQPSPPASGDFLVIGAGRSVAVKVQRVVGVIDGEPEASPERSEAPGFVAGYLHASDGPITILSVAAFLLPETREQLDSIRDAVADEVRR